MATSRHFPEFPETGDRIRIKGEWGVLVGTLINMTEISWDAEGVPDAWRVVVRGDGGSMEINYTVEVEGPPTPTPVAETRRKPNELDIRR